MKRMVKNIILVAVLFVLGCLLSLFFADDKDIIFIDNEFLTSFVGVVLGISATIVTFIYSSTDKVWDIISNTFQSEEDAERVRKKFKKGYTEIIEDSSFIFVIFILLIICVIISAVDIPNISFPDSISKACVISAIKTGLLINCLVSIRDLFFSLCNILKLGLYENPKSSK